MIAVDMMIDLDMTIVGVAEDMMIAEEDMDNKEEEEEISRDQDMVRQQRY